MDKQYEHKRLKRELMHEALLRLEDAARSKQDFDNVIAWWDRLERNEQRRVRSHEIGRGDIPLEWQMSDNAMLFPASLNIFAKQMLQGDLTEIIFNCLYELHELIEEKQISKILKELNIKRKEILYYSAIRLYSAAHIAELRGQTDRNIRKIRLQTIQYIRQKLEVNYE